MKKLLFVLMVCFGCATANAQISTGESSSKVLRTGNRAQAGNFGIYFGATTDMFKNLSDNGPEKFSTIPLINLKYMANDNFEYRLGLEWFSKSDTEDGGTKVTASESQFNLSPGIAYHFNRNNLLDVYVGGELPFGFGSNGVEYDGHDESASNFRIGLGAFIGLQAYVANLPVAVGVEYGLSAMTSSVSDGVISEDGMSIKSLREDFDSSKSRIGHQVRFTLSYYFNL